jgi:amidase/aspartyl-tRNA(Asn)/glutamyl-tRNA(Gln) amidotransferase subunit A
LPCAGRSGYLGANGKGEDEMSGSGNDMAWRSAAELAGLIRARKLSPVEVMQAVIARIEARNPSLNAFVHTDFEGALAAARRAEQDVMDGAALGLFHGVPIAMKDLFDFKPGWPATLGGVRAMKDWRPDLTCLFVERMERAGAILVGKCNSPIMGFRGVTDNYLFGPTRNPFDPTRNPGGSSGGSAAAVADGLVPLAEGTDGGGSIRIPASWSGIYGFKASFGRVPLNSRPDAFSPANCFIHEGPLARTVEDAALALEAIAGPDARDPFSLPDRLDFLGATRRSIKGMKIAWTPDFGVYPVEPAVVETCRAALAAFEAAGAIVEEVKIDIKRHHRELADLWCKLIMPLTVGAFETLKANGVDLMGTHRADLPPELTAWVERSAAMTVTEMLECQTIRTEINDAIQGVLDRYDFLVSPTLAALPVKNGTDGNTLGPAEINGEPVERLIGWCMTYFINFTGHPAASIPAGLAPGNLPVGLQIIGRRMADDQVIAASAAFERIRPWADSYRICEARPLDA